MKVDKYKDFYIEHGLKIRLMEDGLPDINGIDCCCDSPKGCGYSCHSGTPCDKFKPNHRFDNIEGVDPNEFDWNKDYKPPPSKLELLETRLLKLENKK